MTLKLKIAFILVFINISSALCADGAASKANEDFSLFDSFLDNNYQRGGHLVYDCLEKHWVCTGAIEYNRCLRYRSTALKDNKNKLPCGVVKKFKNEKVCQLEQSRLTSRSDYSRFCFHDNYRRDHKDY